MTEKKLKVQNFGPIGTGFTENDGFMSIPKITILCGSQGVGKSCIAKLYSTFSWLEKALVRGDFSINYLTQYNRFVKTYCAFQNLQNYFSADTYLHYQGTAFEIVYQNSKLQVTSIAHSEYERPQIIYIPAERNLLSVVENAENVKGLPQALASMLEVYDAACKNLKADVHLPVNQVYFHYDPLNKISWIQTDKYKVRLNEASSGMQSVTPMYIVLDYLSRSLSYGESLPKNDKSLKEKENIQKRINELLKDDSLDPQVRKLLIEQAADVSNKYMLNVVEEPEQNLFPSSQRNVLNSLLAFASDGGNQLMITTHSPYIINYLSLAIKADSITRQMKDSSLCERLDQVVPLPAQVDGTKVVVYEISDTGEVHRLPTYENMPSDNNFLNNYLAETNDLFNELLEIEEACQK